MADDRPRKISISVKPPKHAQHAPPIVRKVPGHKCDLRLSEDQIYTMISEGLFVDLRRRFRKWLTVSLDHPYSKALLKSTAQIDREAMKHWRNHYYMIHPFSKVRFFWEMVMIPVLLAFLVLNPVDFASAGITRFRLAVRLILNLLSVTDIVLWFFTGYFRDDQSKVVLDCRQVAKRYLVTFFFWDVLSIVPIVELQFILRKPELYPYKLLLLLKIVRLPTLTGYLSKLCLWIQRGEHFVKLFNFFLWCYALIIWTTCIIYVFTNQHMFRNARNDEDMFPKLLTPMIINLYDVIMTVLEVGVGEVQNISTWKMVSDIVALMLGTALNTVVLAKVMQLFQRRLSTKHKYSSLLAEIGEYMKFKELPSWLRQKVFSYVHFKFQKNIFKEDDILNTISSVLKQDILKHTCQSMIERVDFFKDLPHHVMIRIVTKLRSEIFMAGDVIVMAGYPGNAMYFLYSGTVAVYTSTGKEICHLEDGEHFGEIALLINAPRVATVVAIKDCEVFKLNRRDFQEAIEPFLDLRERIRQLAMARLETTMKITEEDTESQQSQQIQLQRHRPSVAPKVDFNVALRDLDRPDN